MMKRLPALLASVFLISVWTCAFAQSSLSGAVITDDPQGFTVIACFIDVAINDCDGEKSRYINVNADGTYAIDGLDAGQYLVIAWKDSNGSGDLEEGQDEFFYYVDANAEIAAVSPPASNIVLQASASTAPASNPLSDVGATTGASELTGIWQAGLGGNYDPSLEDWGFGDSVATDVGHWYQFNADGSYQSRFGMNVVSFGTCRQKILIAETGTYTLQNDLLTLTATSAQKKSDDNCDDDPSKNYVSNIPSQTIYKLARFVSEGLELTSLTLNAAGSLEVDPEDSTPIVLRKEMP
jgi:hypothetical protein